jgi:hypothetical protein
MRAIFQLLVADESFAGVVVVDAIAFVSSVPSLLVCLFPSASIVIVVAVLVMSSCRFRTSQSVLRRVFDWALLCGFGIWGLRSSGLCVVYV